MLWELDTTALCVRTFVRVTDVLPSVRWRTDPNERKRRVRITARKIREDRELRRVQFQAIYPDNGQQESVGLNPIGMVTCSALVQSAFAYFQPIHSYSSSRQMLRKKYPPLYVGDCD